MKKVLFLFLAATVLWSCQNTHYTIKGTVADPGFEGANVYLQVADENNLTTVETTTVENGTFTFKGVANTNALHFILIGEQNAGQMRGIVLLEPGTIHVVFDGDVTVKGTRANDLFNSFRLKQSELSTKAREIGEKFREMETAGTMTEELGAEMRAEHAKIGEELSALTFNFVKKNMHNELGRYLFRNSINSFSEDKQIELLALADENLKAEPRVVRLINRIENAKNVAVGKPFIDFTMKDPEGNMVSLSDFVGKGNYVLVDFWAAWCPPCRAKMPHMVEIYAKYKSKGLEIVGVSLDGQFGDERDHAAWVAGIQNMNMTWPQMSDLKFWESPVVELYAFNGIPHLILLGKDGTIIARNEDLHGEALDAKLASLMP